MEKRAKFMNENAKAKSNLREKSKTFNFQAFEGDSSSDEKQEIEQQIETSMTTDQDELKELMADLPKRTHKNPFAMRLHQRS